MNHKHPAGRLKAGGLLYRILTQAGLQLQFVHCVAYRLVRPIAVGDLDGAYEEQNRQATGSSVIGLRG